VLEVEDMHTQLNIEQPTLLGQWCHSLKREAMYTALQVVDNRHNARHTVPLHALLELVVVSDVRRIIYVMY